MNLPEAMLVVLAHRGGALTARELAEAVSARFPHLLATRGRLNSPVGLDPIDALTSAVGWTANRSRRFQTNKSVKPMTVSLAPDGKPVTAKASNGWSDAELEASVHAYMTMRHLEISGEMFVKKDVFRSLALQINRSEKAIEYRMQNISAVFSLAGRAWVSGLLPARNIGREVLVRLESIIAAYEGRPSTDQAISVASPGRLRGKSGELGSDEPETQEVSSVRYVRDAKVRAWILNAAKGVCDLCLKPAPFEALLGPFLEVHHLRRLADGGSDRISNAVALCPNCHRRLHYGLDAPECVKLLRSRLSRLRPPTQNS